MPPTCSPRRNTSWATAVPRGKDQGDNLHTEKQLLELDSPGYQAAIAAGAQTIMASYSSWQGQKMHGNHALLTEVLKGRFGFEGLVIGDWNGHAQLPGCTASDCPAAVNAGIDMLMAPDGWHELLNNTLAESASGQITGARLDDAVRRVLRVKLRAHLDTEGRPSARPYAGHYELLGSPEHRAVARRAVRESLVLLKNRNHLLPLSRRCACWSPVTGPTASPSRAAAGPSTGRGPSPTRIFRTPSPSTPASPAAWPPAGGTPNLSPDGQFTTRPDVAIVVFGENPYAEYAGDVHTLEYSPGDKRDLALLKRLHALDVPVVAVFLSGRPLWVNAELNAADSFVAAWLPGPEGGGIAEVLFRAADGAVNFDFRGTLPFSWPATPRPPAVDGLPGEAPLFPFGYGLTYADDGYLRQLPEVDVPPPLPPAPPRRRRH